MDLLTRGPVEPEAAPAPRPGLVPVPEARARDYRTGGLWSELPVGARLNQVATAYASRPAVITADAEMTYAELDRRTDQVAAGLLGLGLSPGGPVLFQLSNRLETVVAWYGCLKAGLVPVATLAAHRMHEIGYISRKVGAVAHLVEAGTRGFDLVEFAVQHAEGHPTLQQVIAVGASHGALPEGVVAFDDVGRDAAVREARAAVEHVQSGLRPEDVAVFQLSGGTTGVPKVIPRLHCEYWENGRFYAEYLGWDERVRVAHLIPLIHNAGISCALHAAHSVGACLVLATSDAPSAFALMARTRATDALIGHGHFQAVLGADFEKARPFLRRVVLSGAKVPPELFDRVQAQGAWAGQMFGMSEGLFTVTALDAPDRARRTTVGTGICTADEVIILAPGTEDRVPDGEVGELCCRGPYTIAGYFDEAERNRVAFTSDGYYRTGDLASLQLIDDVRYLTMEGRLKDVINRGGEKVNAEEVELLLGSHPGVSAAAVVAMPDARLGERACAFLVPASDAASPANMPDSVSLQSVQRHLEQLGVAKFKWPERIERTDALPRTNVGKVDKTALRELIAAQVEAEAADPG